MSNLHDKTNENLVFSWGVCAKVWFWFRTWFCSANESKIEEEGEARNVA
jgi:hypothetical protein